MLEPSDLHPAVFLDRDGTLMEEVGYCGNPADVRVYPGIPGALEELRLAGFKLIVVTNQSGVARGYFTEADYYAVHAEFLRQLQPARLDGTYFCADDPDHPSFRRKPNPGMLLEAAAAHHVDLSRSFMIGDRGLDIEAGRAAGVRTVLVETLPGDPQLQSQPDAKVKDLVAAAEWILRNRS